MSAKFSRAHKPLAFAQARRVSEGSDAALIQLEQEEAAMCKLMVVVARFLSLCAVLLALPAVAATEFSVVITFNEFPIGTIISDQYKPQGILFSGDSPFITDDPDTPTSPVLSGAPRFEGAIEGIFVNPNDGNVKTVNGFQLSAGKFDSIGSVELTWFDLNGNVLGAKRNSQIGIETFTILQEGIARWRISIVANEPFGYDIDNVAFNLPNPTIRKPGKFKKQPVYPTEIPQGLASNLIVIVHGCCTDENDLTAWRGVKSSIQNAISQNQTPGAWEIVVWDWTNVTKIKIPDVAYLGAVPYGQYLGKEIVNPSAKPGWKYNYVHFIAHSAGSRLIHEAAKYIRNKDGTPPFIHSTFLDAYCHPPLPLLDATFYAYYSDYAEQYVDRGLPLTDLYLWAYNFDVTDLPKPVLGKEFPSHYGWPNDIILDYHFWPVDWYQQSIDKPGEFRFGFPLSFEYNRNVEPPSKFYDRLKQDLKSQLNISPGDACVLTSNTECRRPGLITLPPPIVDYTRLIGSWITGGAAAVKTSITGIVEWLMGDALTGVSATLKTGSPVWVEAPITTTRTFNLIKFNYEFLSATGSEGIMTVFVDDNPVYKIDERITDPGINTARHIPVGDLSPGEHTIGFRLDPFTGVQSVARISNIKFGEVVKRLSPRCQELLVGQNCGTPSSISCISLRIPVGATCQGECAESTAGRLRAEGINVLGPSGGLPEGFPPACVGFRPDIAGTAEGAQCLVDFLGPPYQLEDLGGGRRCRVDGFPYNVYLK